ncbi:claudin-10-like [Aplochiton taeniatus]
MEVPREDGDNMKYRTLVMYMEIGCFVSCLAGWILVSSTLPIEYWVVSEGSGTVVTSGDAYFNLWKDCVSDNSGVTDCKEYPSMLDLSAFLHVSRALVICSVITGFFGGVLTLIGMKCTKIGGSELANARVTFAGGITYMVSGLCGLITYSYWGHKVITEFLDPYFMTEKYELGAALFIGWGGSLLLIAGASIMIYFSGKEGLPINSEKMPRRPATHATSRTRRTYMLPLASSRATLVPSLPRSRAADGT